MTKKISVSAPGKLMLFGEHAVLYDRPCLVTAVDQRMHATVEVLDTNVFQLEAEEVKITGYTKALFDIGKGDIPKGAQFVEIALRNMTAKHPLRNGIRITTNSEFSSQVGFGSSSASTVCIVKALSELMELRLSLKDIFDIALKTVLDIQGKGSGFDIAAGVYGGTLYFVTGGKTIKPLHIKELPLIVGYSGIKADTTTIIHQVREKAHKYPEIIEEIYTGIAEIVGKAKEALLGSDFQTVGDLMNMNQGYLEALGVSTQKLSAMIYGARDNGAYGAKLSGAGGGDCMIAFSSEEKRKDAAQGITNAGGQVIPVVANADGVRIEV